MKTAIFQTFNTMSKFFKHSKTPLSSLPKENKDVLISSSITSSVRLINSLFVRLYVSHGSFCFQLLFYETDCAKLLVDVCPYRPCETGYMPTESSQGSPYVAQLFSLGIRSTVSRGAGRMFVGPVISGGLCYSQTSLVLCSM